MYNTLIFTVENQVAEIKFNRPDRYNAFNNEMSFEFIDALKKCGKDSNIRSIIISGEGKAFCSGQDLKDVEAQAGMRSLGESVEKRYNPMTRLIINTEKPFICKLHGVAAGAGAGVALACDYVIASDNASLLFAFANIGLVLDSGSSYNLPRLVGKRKAFELATLGEKITAQQALDYGMVNQLVPAEQLDQAVMNIALNYAQRPTKAIGLIKRMLNKSFHSDLETMLEMEMYCQEIAGKTDDYIEGVMSFIQKRKPEFKGK